MKLDELIKDIYDGELQRRFNQWDIRSISSDSRKVKTNDLFVALKGSAYNGADFIDEVIEKGACVIVTDGTTRKTMINSDVCHLTVEDTDKFLRDITQRFYGNPSAQVRTIGITGTNGKTTISYLIESILQEAGKTCGVIGTVNYRIGDKVFPSNNTTPGFLDNQQYLFDIAKAGVDYCLMEVSSHALDQGRVDGIDFKTAVFTNLTSDHLDYHKTTEKYFSVKAKLFTNLSTESCAVINVDDDNFGRELIAMTNARVMTYSIKHKSDVMAKNIQCDISGTKFKLISPQGETLIFTKLVGIFNVYNILAAVSACLAEHISLERIKVGIERLAWIPGRLEKIDGTGEYSIFIDYAHTQDALENVLQTIKQICRERRSAFPTRIILVFGCGGDRDKTKRAEMGKVASRWADISIVTSDNPRSENPQSIIDQIVRGFGKDNYMVVLNREEAIQKALEIVQNGDIILITGKGHETRQIFKDNTIDFDERKIIRKYLKC